MHGGAARTSLSDGLMKNLFSVPIIVALLATILQKDSYAQARPENERPVEMSQSTRRSPQSSLVDSDTTEARPGKIGGRDTWEKVVSPPGDLLYLPFDLIFEGVEASIEFVDENKVIPRFIDFLTCDDGSCGVLPTYASRSGGGVKLFHRGLLTRESYLSLSLTAGLRGRQRYQLRLRGLKPFGWAVSSDYLLRYQLLSDEALFGIGPASDFKDDRSNFAHEQVTGEGRFGVNLGKNASVNATAGFDINEISKGRDNSPRSNTGSFTKLTLPGLDEQVRVARLHTSLQHDSRNRPGNPSRGGEELLKAGIFIETGGDEFGFWKLSADLTRYIHLFYNRVLVLRVAGEVTEPLSDREIPFYYLSELGRHEIIRGFTRGRFRDRDMVLGSAEYRYPIWHSGADALLFVDAGKVSEDIFDEFTDHFHVSYGVGIRVWSRRGLITGLEIGWSADEIRIHFGLN